LAPLSRAQKELFEYNFFSCLAFSDKITYLSWRFDSASGGSVIPLESPIEDLCFLNSHFGLDFYVLYSTLLHLPPVMISLCRRMLELILKDFCDFGIGRQTL
jgi:hypothetical protein